MNQGKMMRKVFELYMDSKHPYVYPVLGILKILFGISIMVAISGVFWCDDWWKFQHSI